MHPEEAWLESAVLARRRCEVRRHTRRCVTAVLTIVIGSIWCGAPAQADTPNPGLRGALTTVPTSTMKALQANPSQALRRQQSRFQAESGFFKTRKGAVAIGLMAAGAAFSVWSINHDRKPVKSAIR
jgi:hypothetical protein